MGISLRITTLWTLGIAALRALRITTLGGIAALGIAALGITTLGITALRVPALRVAALGVTTL